MKMKKIGMRRMTSLWEENEKENRQVFCKAENDGHDNGIFFFYYHGLVFLERKKACFCIVRHV